MDLEEEYLSELDGKDLSGCKEELKKLLADRERRREAVERLQEKLKALNFELAARKEDAETQRCRLQEQMEINRHAQTEETALAKHEGADFSIAEVNDVRRVVEQTLRRAQPDKPELNELGLRIFDERDLIIGTQLHPTEPMCRTTVLITHYRSASSEHKYHLSYRVGQNTTARKLREDACAYWGISEVEYVLWILPSGCKVQDDILMQTLFKPFEEAHVILAPKTPKKVEPPEKVPDLIRAKTGPKARQTGKKKKEVVVEVEEEKGAQDERKVKRAAPVGNFYEQMAEIPGLFTLMTQRDMGIVDHVKRVRCSSFFFYFVLTVLTVTSLVMARPPDKSYNCRYGVTSVVEAAGPVPFAKIRSTPEVWDWFEAVLTEQLFVNNSNLRQGNLVLGNVAIWMQQVKDPKNESDSLCDELLPESIQDTKCFPEEYIAATAGTEDLEALKRYWTPLDGLDGRVNGTYPWKFVEGDEALAKGVFAEDGWFYDYDAAGYVLAYNMRENDTAGVRDAIVQDFAKLKELQWIGPRTRAVHLHFGVYNINYDMWTSAWYMFELPLSGLVWPHSEVYPFTPIFDADTGVGFTHLVLDGIRLGLVVSLIFLEVIPQALFKSKKDQQADKDEKEVGYCMAFCNYLLGWRGILDISIIGLFLLVFIVRFFSQSVDPRGATAQERSNAMHGLPSKDFEDLWRTHMIGEAVLLAVCCLRVLSLTQINRHYHIIWKTCTESVRRYFKFLILGFLLPLIGFVTVSQSLWRTQTLLYRTWWASWSSIIMALVGDTSALLSLVDAATRPLTTVFQLIFYSVLHIWIINLWVATVIHSYHDVRVTRGWKTKDSQWTEYEYVSWILRKGPKWLYLKVRPSIRPDSDDEEEEQAKKS